MQALTEAASLPSGRRVHGVDRVLLMLSEGWHAWEHYLLGRTRKEVAPLLGLTPRQVRTCDELFRRAHDHFGIAHDIRPPFRGRPPLER